MKFNPTTASPSDYFNSGLGCKMLPARMPCEHASLKRPLHLNGKLYKLRLLSDKKFTGRYGPKGRFPDQPNLGVVIGKVPEVVEGHLNG